MRKSSKWVSRDAQSLNEFINAPLRKTGGKCRSCGGEMSLCDYTDEDNPASSECCYWYCELCEDIFTQPRGLIDEFDWGVLRDIHSMADNFAYEDGCLRVELESATLQSVADLVQLCEALPRLDWQYFADDNSILAVGFHS